MKQAPLELDAITGRVFSYPLPPNCKAQSNQVAAPDKTRLGAGQTARPK